MEHDYMKAHQARDYIHETYGIEWTAYWVRKLALRGVFRFIRPTGPRGHVYISRQSIDEAFTETDQE